MKIALTGSLAAALLAPALLSMALADSAQEREQQKKDPDASERVELALARARHENQRVLVLWARAEKDCEPLSALFDKNRKLGKLLNYEYVRVQVLAGEQGARGLATRLGVDLTSELPVSSIFDAAGKLLANTALSGWRKDGRLDAGLIEASLLEHKAEPLDAGEVYERALARAAKSGKRLFVHLGAPW